MMYVDTKISHLPFKIGLIYLMCMGIHLYVCLRIIRKSAAVGGQKRASDSLELN